MRMRWMWVMAALALILAACQARTTPQASPVSEATPEATPVPKATVLLPLVHESPLKPKVPRTPGPPVTPISPPGTVTSFTLDDAVALARADLAARLGIKPEDVRVISAVHEEMPLHLARCEEEKPSGPVQPAMVMGYEIILEAQGQTYVYRGMAGRVKLCREGGKTMGSEVPRQLLDAVLEDLASRLKAAKSEVEVLSVEEVTWPDASLGCPEPGKVYAQVLTPGYRIVLKAQGRTYTYHTDRSRHFVLCPPRK